MAGLNLVAGVKAASYAERGDDLYETPVEAVDALLAAEALPYYIWEPACGRGAIVNRLRQAGHYVHASDLNDYGCLGAKSGVDFLAEKQSRFDVEAIVTNPPFRLAGQFAEHAIAMAPKAVMLLRLAFLESARRTGVLESGKLARVHVFRNLLPMMHRDGWAGPKTAQSAVAFAWFVWIRDWKGPTELHRLSWRKAAASNDNEPQRIAA